mmetsp:Transcript_6148/g.21613  ORF Transcript_6148/g.21613 Transcript_6148/m.21613 type:complete len:235 (-) Transcript_6148:1445-2149(-)
MLRCYQLGRRHERPLPAHALILPSRAILAHDGEQGQKGHHRLAAPHVALQQPHHRRRALQVAQHVAEHAVLRLGQLPVQPLPGVVRERRARHAAHLLAARPAPVVRPPPEHHDLQQEVLVEDEAAPGLQEALHALRLVYVQEGLGAGHEAQRLARGFVHHVVVVQVVLGPRFGVAHVLQLVERLAHHLLRLLGGHFVTLTVGGANGNQWVRGVGGGPLLVELGLGEVSRVCPHL